jgi:hypothetical protein
MMLVLLVMLAITAIVALPLYLLARALGWLRWGHALLAGMLSGALPLWIVGFGLIQVLAFAAFGGVIGLLFWWLRIFRNPAFPDVPTSMPWSMALLIPAACLWFWYLSQISEQRVFGRVDSVAATATGVDLRMKDGSTFSVVGRGLQPHALPRGTCLVLMTRRSVTLLERRTYISHKLNVCPE